MESSNEAKSAPVRESGESFSQKMPTVAGNQPVRQPTSQCAVCSGGSAVYKCPACLVVTCSLKCVKAHKEATGCTGKRPRSEFAPIGQFSEAMLLRDYRFLEEVARSADASHRGIREYGTMRVPLRGRGRGGRGRGRGGHGGKAFGLPHLPRHLHLLMRAAKDRSVGLRLMPLGMQRHIDNTSRYDTKTDALWWRVEWLFLLKDGTELRAASYRVPDDAGVAAAAGEALAYLTSPEGKARSSATTQAVSGDESPPPHVVIKPPQAASAEAASPWDVAPAEWKASVLSCTTAAPAPTLLPPKQRRLAHSRGATQASKQSAEQSAAAAVAADTADGLPAPGTPPGAPPGAAAADTPADAAAASDAGSAASAAPVPDPAAEVAALPAEPPGLFLQHPFAERGGHVYHSVPGTATVRAALWGRTIVEFPCFAVCLSDEQTQALSLRQASDTPVPDHTHTMNNDSDDEASASRSKRPRAAAAAASGMPPPHTHAAAATPSAGHTGSVRWAHNTFAPPGASYGMPPTPAYSGAATTAVSGGASASSASSVAAFSAAAAAVAQRSHQAGHPPPSSS